MRKAFLVVVLVAASFLGGAFVNGPGLQWAERHVLRYLGLNNTGEIASVDLKPAASSEADLDELRSAQPVVKGPEGPRAPMPSLVAEHESLQHDSVNSSSALIGGSESSSHDVAPDHAQGIAAASASTTRLVALTKAPEQHPATVDPSVKQASATASQSTGSGALEHPDSKTKPDILDTLVALLPANSHSPVADSASSPLPSLPTGGTQKPIVHGSDNWTVIERKMQSLGVSRYMIEGEPDGRVVFSCLIPVAGRQAITQRFEAEGDDIIKAAQATLQRITLWRATQPIPR